MWNDRSIQNILRDDKVLIPWKKYTMKDIIERVNLVSGYRFKESATARHIRAMNSNSGDNRTYHDNLYRLRFIMDEVDHKYIVLPKETSERLILAGLAEAGIQIFS